MKNEEPLQSAVATHEEHAPAGADPEILISNLLRYGLAFSLSLVVFGTSVTFFNHPDYFSSSEALERLTRPDHAPNRLAEVLQGVFAIRGQAFVMIGVLSLISIPMLRVVLSFFVFRQQKNRAFMIVTGTVLLMLIVSIALGRATH